MRRAEGPKTAGMRRIFMQQREKFASRLGFILISAGCAIGLGNVWRFPYITGKYGGAAFVILYLLFLVILGLPVMVMEFAVGRASQKSCAKSFEILEPKGCLLYTSYYRRNQQSEHFESGGENRPVRAYAQDPSDHWAG